MNWSNKHYRFRVVHMLFLMLCIFCMITSFGSGLDWSMGYLSLLRKYSAAIGHDFSDNQRIHIVVVVDNKKRLQYQHHGKTLLCYAHRHGYQFVHLNPQQYYTCSRMTNFFFKKHCAVMLYLIQNPHARWVVVLDGDTFVANATKSLKSFIPNDPNIHVVHYERFWNNEITAGNYIIRNHPWSLLYLNKWVESFEKMPNVSHHNNDNGILHLHFLDMVGKLDDYTHQICLALYNNASDETLYMKYVACTKCALKGQRKFSHIILSRRAHSFCRDIGPPMEKIHQFDLMLHGYKGDLDHFLEESVNSSSCITELNWTPKLRRSFLISDLEAAKVMIRQWEELASKRYPETVGLREIADCWPNCDPEITGIKLLHYISTLCGHKKQQTL